jgi:hypothetical protein
MTPQEQAVPPGAQKSWFARYWMWLVGGGCLAALLCCGVFSLLGGVAALAAQEADAARVDCGTPGPSGVDCEVKRTAGTGAFEACWDLEIACTNQSTMVGHACGTVAAAQPRTTVTMAVSTFSNQDACDAPARGEVKNLVVTTKD